ncbi:MAG: DDE-type integrase/transposase/recombinase [bacterium]|nr:DDE-type integrase/transposase/recombinase [bacterium]
MAYLEVRFHEHRCTIISQDVCCEIHDTWENRNVWCVILRSLCSPKTGNPLFSDQCLADAFGDKARQHINNDVREYEQCDENFFEYLRHTRKIDPVVVDAVRAELDKDILARTETVRIQVNQRLGREDITSDTIRTAFEQIPCTVIRQQALRGLAEGTFHPKETVVLAELFAALEQDGAGGRGRNVGGNSSQATVTHSRDGLPPGNGESRDENADVAPTNTALSPDTDTESEKLLRYAEQASAAGREALHEEPDEAIIQKRQAACVEALLTPQLPLSEIPEPVTQMVTSMAMYQSGASFSQRGRWFGEKAKSTMYIWVIGLALALWPVIQGWLWCRVRGRRLLVDEKWIKIRTTWHDLFCAVDHDSGLPLFHSLLPSRTTWACRLFLLKLRRLGKTPSAISTDGLKGYTSAIKKVFPGARHLGCLFHHQHTVTRCVKTQFCETETEEANAINTQMKQVIQTHDTRTVNRRLDRIETHAEKKGWRKIVEWCKRTRDNLTHLLPALRSNTHPSTTNEIERFFRACTRFCKMRCGFHSVKSATREIIFFIVVYLFSIQAESGKAPIETILPDANTMPFSRLLNYPFAVEMTAQPSQDVKNVKLAEEMATESVEELA